MGAWGPDTFENDTACDWVGDLERFNEISFVEDTLEAALGLDYIDADTGANALAAADVVARMLGRFGQRDAYTENLDAWVAAHPQRPSAELTALAVRAIDRTAGESSELAELWENDAGWVAAVNALRGRVA